MATKNPHPGPPPEYQGREIRLQIVVGYALPGFLGALAPDANDRLKSWHIICSLKP